MRVRGALDLLIKAFASIEIKNVKVREVYMSPDVFLAFTKEKGYESVVSEVWGARIIIADKKRGRYVRVVGWNDGFKDHIEKTFLR